MPAMKAYSTRVPCSWCQAESFRAEIPRSLTRRSSGLFPFLRKSTCPCLLLSRPEEDQESRGKGQEQACAASLGNRGIPDIIDILDSILYSPVPVPDMESGKGSPPRGRKRNRFPPAILAQVAI